MPATQTETPRPDFEYELCPRCLGEGTYSYNQVDGQRCYGCSQPGAARGSGYSLTKRGQAAQDFYNDLLAVTGDELLANPDAYVGHLVRAIVCQGVRISTDRIRVATVEPWQNGGVTIRNGKGSSKSYLAGTTFKVIPSAAQRAEKLAVALAYQATLDANGNVVA